MNKIRSDKEYKTVMKTIEKLLDKVTRSGGFHLLPKEESVMMAQLSKLAEGYEDNTMKLIPINLRSS